MDRDGVYGEAQLGFLLARILETPRRCSSSALSFSDSIAWCVSPRCSVWSLNGVGTVGVNRGTGEDCCSFLLLLLRREGADEDRRLFIFSKMLFRDPLISDFLLSALSERQNFGDLGSTGGFRVDNGVEFCGG